jgi:hypothetical protein
MFNNDFQKTCAVIAVNQVRSFVSSGRPVRPGCDLLIQCVTGTSGGRTLAMALQKIA